MPSTIDKQEHKFKELVLYVSRKSTSDPRFGATKLNKILFFADFIAYGKLGSPITGVDYQRLEWGPAPRRLKPIRREMEEARELAVQRVEYLGKEQVRTIALREPDLSIFSGAEIAVVDEVIAALWNHNAVEASDLSHRTLAWELARDGETVPYEAVFITKRPLTEEELAHAGTIEV